VLPDASADAMLHYAPPLTGAKTTVALEPGMRRVRYALTLYEPLSEATRARLAQCAASLAEVSRCEVLWEDSPARPGEAVLEIAIEFSSLDEYRKLASTVVEAIVDEPDILTALLAGPWQTDLSAYRVDHLLWRDRYDYVETVDLSALDSQWQEQAQYTSWRLIELRNAKAETDAERQILELTSLAMREQYQTWRQIPASCYWVFDMTPGSLSRSVGATSTVLDEHGSWVVSWGQDRELAASYAVYHRQAILRTAAAAVGVLVLLISILIVRGSRLTR